MTKVIKSVMNFASLSGFCMDIMTNDALDIISGNIRKLGNYLVEISPFKSPPLNSSKILSKSSKLYLH